MSRVGGCLNPPRYATDCDHRLLSDKVEEREGGRSCGKIWGTTKWKDVAENTHAFCILKTLRSVLIVL